tara:strand:- start:1769 stop:3226 length:1458 start_codon:yes stop_codon:yes gene_type:complete
VIQEKENFPLTNWEIVSVNPSDKNWTWQDLFYLWGNSVQSIIGFSLVASLYLMYNLNFLVVLSGCLVASFLVYILSNLIGLPSQKHGLPFPVILRTSMGVNGARYIALLRGLVGIFMFGVQTYFISKSIGYLIRITLFSIDNTLLNHEIFLSFIIGLNLIDWIAFIFTLLFQYILFSNGQSFNRSFIKFSALFVYFGLILFLIIIISENFKEVSNSVKLTFSIDNALAKKNIIPLLTVIGTMFTYFSIIIVNFGDFSRYVKNNKELNKGNLSLLLNLILFSSLAILIVLGTDIILVKNMIQVDQLLTSPTDIIGKFDNTYLTIVALIFILFSSLSTNLIANYIPSQNSLLNFLPKNLSLKSSGFIIILLGFIVGLFWLTVLSQIGILSFVDTIGAFFGPIFGIMIADYYLIRGKNILNKDIFSSESSSSYYYSNGWQIKGLYSLIIGFIFAAVTIWNVDLRFLQSYSWLIGAFVSYLTYYLLASD